MLCLQEQHKLKFGKVLLRNWLVEAVRTCTEVIQITVLLTVELMKAQLAH